MSYAAGLANHFGIRYDAGKALSLPLAPAATFGGCVPSYVGVLVLSGVVERAKQQGVLLRPPHDEGFFSEEDVDHVIASVLLALPAVAGAVAARQVCTMGDMAMVAGEVLCFVLYFHPFALFVEVTSFHLFTMKPRFKSLVYDQIQRTPGGGEI